MKNTKSLPIILLLTLFLATVTPHCVRAQVTMAQLRINSRTASVAAGAPVSYLDLEVDGASGDTIDILRSNPLLKVTLALPNGAEVTAATPLGFTRTEVNDAPRGTGLIGPGSHVLFTLPASPPIGTYRVKTDATGIPTSSQVTATFFATSGPAAGLASEKRNYSVGESAIVVLSASNNGQPLLAPSISATVALTRRAASVSVTQTLVSRASVSPSRDRLTLNVSAQNTTPGSLTNVQLRPEIRNRAFMLANGALNTPSLNNGAPVSFPNVLILEVPAGASLAAADLIWSASIEASRTPVSFAYSWAIRSPNPAGKRSRFLEQSDQES